MNVFDFLQACNNFISSYVFLLIVQSIACLLKVVLFYFFTSRMLKTKRIPIIWYFLVTVLIAAALEDFAWVVSLVERIFFPGSMLVFKQFFVRLGWASNIVIYQSLSLYIENFTQRTPRIRWYQYIFIPISLIFLFFFLYQTSCIHLLKTTPLENTLREYQSIYALLILMPFTVLVAVHSLRKAKIPRILHHQLRIVIQFLLVPHLIANLCQVYPFSFLIGGGLANNLAAVSISGIFLTLALYYCIRKIIGLRFLNIHSHVHEHNSHKFNFVNDFKNTLEDLGNVSSTREIKLIVQHFIKRAFSIPTGSTSLYVRSLHHSLNTELDQPAISQQEIALENFIGTTSLHSNAITEALDSLKSSPIFIRDEIEYNNFYEQTETRNIILSFLDAINADIFLPIYEDGRVIASIVIERNARPKKLYTNIERDEMLVFASYLSKIINLLQNRNLNELLKQRKEIIEELYLKHQEINQYKESMRSFLRTNKENSFGLLFYKNRKFTFGNKNGSEIITINPNTQEGDPLVKTLRNLVHQVELYKTTQTIITHDAVGKKLVFTGLPHPESSGVIVTVHYPEISDIVKQLIDKVKNPSNWDYLLYLETTQSGKLINDLIPGTGEVIINFKIDLLKLALTKKALLLELPEEDLLPTVELVHHISLRETLYTLDIQSSATGSDIPIKLFGINPIFGSSTVQPLLERLNKNGTLFIKNVHFLDKETQEILAEFIRYGFYRIFKSEKKVQADVRIICSTNQNLSQLVQKGIFSSALFNELSKSSLSFPSVMTLPHEELEELVLGFSQQALATQTPQENKLLALSEKEKEKIINQKPISLYELKERVQNSLIHKTKKNESLYDIQFDPAYNISDPKLIEASRLGKHALKDPKIMALLWDKFKNQNKIALFLGVNRSSVNRRCKDYGLL
jgi:hypothetical protein